MNGPIYDAEIVTTDPWPLPDPAQPEPPSTLERLFAPLVVWFDAVFFGEFD